MRAQGGDQGIVSTRIAGGPFDDALSRLSPAEPAGEAKIGAALIDEFQVGQRRAPFLGEALPKPVPEATDTRGVPQTIMQ